MAFNSFAMRIMTVPAAVRELEKIEIVRQTDGEYYRDYAVTATQKSILKAFDLAETNIRKQAAGINEDLTAQDHQIGFNQTSHQRRQRIIITKADLLY